MCTIRPQRAVAAPGSAQDAPQPEQAGESRLVGEVRFEGAVQLTQAYLRGLVRTAAGFPVDQAVLDDDVQNLLKSGKLLAADARSETIDGSLVITFVIRERPTITDIRFLGNVKFKGGKFDDADNYFDKAAQCFSEISSLINLVQLYMTVARLNLVTSRKESTSANLEKAKKVAKELGDPESVIKSIGEIEEMLNKIDKI